jgi:hypothetical protein
MLAQNLEMKNNTFNLVQNKCRSSVEFVSAAHLHVAEIDENRTAKLETDIYITELTRAVCRMQDPLDFISSAYDGVQLDAVKRMTESA